VKALELIERLCTITELQAEIINEQAAIIAQSNIDTEIASKLTCLRNSAEEEKNKLSAPDE
jgi:hypothetical protein